MTEIPQWMDFAALVTFVKSAETRSFTAAARQLGLTASGVSKAVSRLEDGLGVRLFARTTRTVRLTQDGEIFYARCRPILADLDAARGCLLQRHAAPRGTLRVSAPAAFGRRVVVPIVARFRARYPEVSVHVALSDRLVDLVEEGFDVAVRVGRLADTGLVARRVGALPYVVCASPDYLARRGTPKTPGDLSGHDCVGFVYPQSAAQCGWSFVLEDAAPAETLAIDATFTTDHGDALVEAATAGAGLIYVQACLVATSIARGALVPVLSRYLPPPTPIHLVYARAKHVTPRVRAFVDFFVDETARADAASN